MQVPAKSSQNTPTVLETNYIKLIILICHINGPISLCQHKATTYILNTYFKHNEPIGQMCIISDIIQISTPFRVKRTSNLKCEDTIFKNIHNVALEYLHIIYNLNKNCSFYFKVFLGYNLTLSPCSDSKAIYIWSSAIFLSPSEKSASPQVCVCVGGEGEAGSRPIDDGN